MQNLNDINQLIREHKSDLMKWHQNHNHPVPNVLRSYTVYQLKALVLLSLETPFDLCLFFNYAPTGLGELINAPEYQSYSLGKKRGGTRIIHKPDWRLRRAQRVLNDYFQAFYQGIKPEEVHGFVITPRELNKRANIVENAKVHVGKKHLLNIDLKDFFPSISGQRVRQVLLSEIFSFNQQMATALALLTTYQGGLPTGAPTSPIISNLICLELDKTIIDYCEEKQLTYTRYADDLTFSSDTKIDLITLNDIKQIIEQHHFQVNEKKVRFRHAGQQQTVTGLVVNDKVNVNRKLLRRVRAMLHDANTNGIVAAANRHFRSTESDSSQVEYFRQKLSGYIEFIGQVRGKEDGVYLRMRAKN